MLICFLVDTNLLPQWHVNWNVFGENLIPMRPPKGHFFTQSFSIPTDEAPKKKFILELRKVSRNVILWSLSSKTFC